MENSINSDIIRGHIDTIILNTLITEDKPVNKIIDEISQKSQGEYEIKQATLYSSLKRLENDKYVRVYFKDTDDLGRRKFYNLTEKGKKYVEDNLKGWNYSRKIINNLLSADADEKDVNESVPEKSEVLKPAIESSNSKQATLTEEKEVSEQIAEDFNIRKARIESDLLKKQTEMYGNTASYSQPEETENPVDYKQVLQTLISKTNRDLSEDDEKNASTAKRSFDRSENIPNTPSFSQSSTKINLTDLNKLSQNEGVKIRVSSKEKVKDIGNILTNKLVAWSAWLIYLVFLAEILVLCFSIDSSAKISSKVYIISAFVGLLFPIIATVLYIKRPKKSINRLASVKLVAITTALVIFNVMLIFCAVILLAELDLSIYRNVILFIVFPIVVLADIPVYFVIKYKLLNTYKFYIK